MPALVIHPLVETDLLEASAWYERQQPGLGARFAREAAVALRRLPGRAQFYAVRFDDVRRMNLKNFPYGVFYFLSGGDAVVVGVLHGARETRDELEKRRSSVA
jgi:plasmid stabilization system protein ParE